jgi:ferrous iron transport protein B
VNSSAAMAYLIFILLYTPCAAALGAVYREAGLKWMTFVAIWTFVIGWIAATVYYQCTLLENSHSAIFWLTGCGGVMISMIIFMRLLGRYFPCKFNVIPKTIVNKKSTGCH